MKNTLLLGSLASLSLALVACPGVGVQNDPAITGLTVSPTTATVAPGGTQNIAVTVTRTGTTAPLTFTCASSNTNVATVTVSGTNCVVSVKTTATNGQTADITATSTANATRSAKATITVSAGAASGTVVRRQNAGGGEIAAATGPAWLADAGATGGTFGAPWACAAVAPAAPNSFLGNSGDAILVPAGDAKYAPQDVYDSERYCPDAALSYTYNVGSTAATGGAGNYLVRLHFGDTGTAARNVDVSITGGSTAVTANDVNVSPATANTAVYKEYTVNGVAANGNIVITLAPGEDAAPFSDPMLRGLEIIKQ